MYFFQLPLLPLETAYPSYPDPAELKFMPHRIRIRTPKKTLSLDTTWKKNEFGMDYAVKQRLSLSEQNCVNLTERHSFLIVEPA